MEKIKGVASKKLREEFPRLQYLSAFGHVPILYLPQEMYRATPLNTMSNNKNKGVKLCRRP